MPVGMKNNSQRRSIRDLLVTLAFLSVTLTGCCPGGACPKQMLGAASMGSCPNASPSALFGALAGALPGCPNGSCPNS